MNIKLKSEILEKSITIETYLSQILMRLLDIDNNENKTLSYKGTALSFKAKVDLLFDIEKIEKNLYNDLVTFMEIRNQFIHNYDTNSFETVNLRINRKKRLIELYDSQTEVEKKDSITYEKKLRIGFLNLSIKIIQDLEITEKTIIAEKIEFLNSKIEIYEKNHELEFKEITNKALADSIDDAMELLDSSFSKSEFGKQLNPNSKLTNYIKSSIFGFLEKNMRKEIDNWKKKNES
ncbi:hypothetical protein [Winogradskyella eximia]|uniref:hypothetical protein n=1 Tax=Winogradskyella eximia TaxID=262006 RepID=UPI002490CE01|nr:hypothetical protein [Winogradskyella eximia]